MTITKSFSFFGKYVLICSYCGNCTSCMLISCLRTQSFKTLYLTQQVLGVKPELSEGKDDDDTEADLSNRKMAKLYMVQYHTHNYTTTLL